MIEQAKIIYSPQGEAFENKQKRLNMKEKNNLKLCESQNLPNNNKENRIG